MVSGWYQNTFLCESAGWSRCNDVRISFIFELHLRLTLCCTCLHLCCSITSPIDVVKTRIMSASNAQYGGIGHAFIHIVKNEGSRALFKGWVPAFTRLGPQTILTFVILEKMKKLYIEKYDSGRSSSAWSSSISLAFCCCLHGTSK